jgi:two-component system NtrC family sensor kinase
MCPGWNRCATRSPAVPPPAPSLSPPLFSPPKTLPWPLAPASALSLLPGARPGGDGALTSGLVLMSAAPVRGPDGSIVGALYGGILLNRDFRMVDRVWELVFKGERFDGKDVGAVTLFQDDVRIATTVKTAGGERAIGTRVSEEVYQTVLAGGSVWRGRAFVVNDWYISAYEPLRDSAGRVVGMLYVGLLEKPILPSATA